MDVMRAKPCGFCQGVARAVRLAREIAERGEKAHTLGSLVHNEQVVRELSRAGVTPINSPEEAEYGTIVTRAHGTEKATREELHDFSVIDATCPKVQELHDAALQLEQKGYHVMVYGDATHPEVRALCSYLRTGTVITEAPLRLPEQPALVAQTTRDHEAFRQLAERLDVHYVDTICGATRERQAAAERVAGQVDVMFVIGGAESSNTKRLAELCRRHVATHHIQSADDVTLSMLVGAQRAGITAGASTPEEAIDAVQRLLERA